MHGLGRDLVYGLRSFLRKPGFTVTALTSLMVGIGTTTAIFTLHHSIFIKPLPLEGLDRLVKVARMVRNDSGEYVGEQPLSFPNYRDYKERAVEFEDLAVYQWWPMYLNGGSHPEKVIGMFVTGNYFRLLGVGTNRGRLFEPEDTKETSVPVAVLTDGAWKRLFGADPNVIGRTIQVNGASMTVVGVVPPGFRGTDLQASVDVFVPVTLFPEISPYGAWFENRGAALFPALGKLRDGTTAAQAEKEVVGIARQLAGEYPEILDELGAKVLPLAESTIRPADRERYRGYGTRLLIVVLILMIACLSVANLLFVRGAERARELAVRQALGAGQGRIFRQLLTENLLLFVIGGLGSLLVAKGFLELLWRFRPPEVPETALDQNLGVTVWGFAMLAAVVSGLIFGLLPALRAARTDLVGNLKESEPFARGRGLPRLLKPRSLVVALQVALALIALIGAGLLLRSLQRTLEIDLGFRSEQIAVLTVAPGDQGYEEAQVRDFYRQLLERARSLPGVKMAGYSQNRLLRGAPMNRQVFLVGQQVGSEIGSRSFHRVNTVGPNFFETAGIKLAMGRNFRDSEPDDRAVVIINETMAEHLWGDQDPVGQTFYFDYPSDNEATQAALVVGVAEDARYRQIREEKQFFIYLPLAQNLATSMALHVRTEGDPAAVLPAMRQAAQELDPSLALTDVGTMRTFVREALWLERASTSLLGLFGALALALALVGVHGLLAYTVRSRKREIGILIALGARRQHVLRAVLFDTFQVVVFGVVLGLIGAMLVLRPILENQLYNVSTLDPIYAFCPLALLLAALLGSLWPAWRATRTDPNETLRAE